MRFREDWTIISDAANFIFDGKAGWTHVGEVRLIDKHGKSAGNIDYVLVSYDDSTEIRKLADKYNLEFRTIPMKTTHHLQKSEIIISDNFYWWPKL